MSPRHNKKVHQPVAIVVAGRHAAPELFGIYEFGRIQITVPVLNARSRSCIDKDGGRRWWVRRGSRRKVRAEWSRALAPATAARYKDDEHRSLHRVPV